jgi:hypothetical protein
LSSKIKTKQQEISEFNSIQVPEEILQVHGYAPPKKAEGTVRLIYENVNGICNRLSGNKKVNRAREIHDDLEVNIAAYCEHKLNMKHTQNSNGFSQLFKEGETTVQSEHLDHRESGKDDTGLGHWMVMTLQGDGVRTRLVCGYNPCGNAKLNSGTLYQQHRRFLVT